MYRPTDRFENWFITSLQTDVNDTTTSFRLNKALNVNQCRLVIDPYDETKREIVKVTSVDGNLVYVERGDDNTAPEYHNEGTIVALHVIAADLNDLYADWAEMEVDLQDAADGANAATLSANSAATAANTAAGNANSAANSANDAAADAILATGDATTAAGLANTAAGSANTAASTANTAATNAQNAADSANDVVDDITAAAFLAAHPVNSIYITVSPTNPSTIYGGTWVAWGSGRVPVGVDTGQTEFNTVEEVGGLKTTRHAYIEPALNNNNFQDTGGAYIGSASSDINTWLTGGGSSSISQIAIVRSVGGTVRTNGNNGIEVRHARYTAPNLQPYITCYMWKRTA